MIVVKYKYISALFFLLGLWLGAGLQSARSQTLNEYLKEAAENNLELKTKYQEYLSKMQKVPQVSALPDPVFSFGYFIMPVETRLGPQQFKFSLQQKFPWFGTLKRQKDAASKAALVSLQEVETLKNQLYFDVKQGYYQLTRLKNDISIVEQNLEVLTAYEALVTNRYENGLAAMSDILRVQLQIREEENKLQKIKDDQVPIRSTFNHLLNREPDLPVVLPDSLMAALQEVNLVAFRDSMLASHPQLLQIESAREALSSQLEVARIQNKPQIGVGLDYVFLGKRTDMDPSGNGRDVLMPMVNMSVPIFNKKKYKAMEQEVKIQLESNELLYSRSSQKLLDAMEVAEAKYKDARRRTKLYQQQILQVQQMLDLLVNDYATSGKEFEEVLRTWQQKLGYQLNYSLAIADLWIAMAQLEFLAGNIEG
ncbi:TolC family protein [Rapidithrix thailandica]|uniref:TolC family protein n=1 Tax=Rapidithrix thailandica TaxID=413964 RepID=A0AAW9S977_9BACT